MRKLFLKIYEALPFKLPLLSFIRLFGPGHGITRHLKFKGKISIKTTEGATIYMQNHGDSLEQSLFWNGVEGWEKYSNIAWSALAKKSAVIFDIGANTGIYTLLAKAINPSATVYAFEPLQKVNARLNENIRLNNLTGVHAYHQAISDSTGHTTIQNTISGNFYEASLNKDHIKSMHHLPQNIQLVTEEISMITLRDFIEEQNITKIDLMKIDVESYEPEVIKGMGEYLYRFEPILLIEILNADVANRLNGFFSPEKYLFYNINEEAGFVQEENLLPSRSFNFIICPRSKADKLSSFLTASPTH